MSGPQIKHDMALNLAPFGRWTAKSCAFWLLISSALGGGVRLSRLKSRGFICVCLS